MITGLDPVLEDKDTLLKHKKIVDYGFLLTKIIDYGWKIR